MNEIDKVKNFRSENEISEKNFNFFRFLAISFDPLKRFL